MQKRDPTPEEVKAIKELPNADETEKIKALQVPPEYAQGLQTLQAQFFAEIGKTYGQLIANVEVMIKQLYVGLAKESIKNFEATEKPAPNRAERRRAEKKVKKDKVKIVEKTTKPQTE